MAISAENKLVAFTTPACMVCNQSSVIHLDEASLNAWLGRQAYIQDVFPELSIDDRELLISGTHSDCWDTLFGGDEEE